MRVTPGSPALDATGAACEAAIGSRALPRLEVLGLEGNQIADAGLAALSAAVGSGAMANLTNLDLDGNPGDAAPAQRASRRDKESARQAILARRLLLELLG